MMNIIQQVTDPMPTNLSYIVSAKLLYLSSLLHLLQTIAITVTILLMLLLLSKLSYYCAAATIIINLQVWLN